MARGKTDLDVRPNTLKENKLVLCELRSRNKADHKSINDTKKLIEKFNAKSALTLSKNAKASLGTKQEQITETPYGPIDGYPPGSWWGIRMDCSRDGVHQPFNKDIHEGPYGAASLCTSHLNVNNDIDLGDYLTFTAEYHISETQSTHPLQKNYQNQLPLRLVRSYNLTNEFAPKTGYRYDGLYAVIGFWIGVTSELEKHYKFALARLRHQSPAAWQLSKQSLNSRLKNSLVKRNRCKREISASNNTPELQNNRSNNVEFSKNSLFSQESSILTRCISKKTEGQSSNCMLSVPYADTSLSCNNRLLDDNLSKPAAFKLQNTNISIRTDLYDSSNIEQQETRKSTPMTFCRTYKNSRLPGRSMTHSNVVSLNLNSCGPCPKDNTQESLIQSRSGIPKFSSEQSPSSDSNNDRFTPKNTSAVKVQFKKILDEKQTNTPEINNSSREPIVVRSTETTHKDILENKEPDKEETQKVSNVAVKTIANISDKKDEDGEEVCTKIDKRTPNSLEILSSDNQEENDKRILMESHTDLDSLTPDQMLNFIVKQKYHPTAKLLIGSVIGLATGESTILRAYESLMTRKNHWSHEKASRTEDNEPRSKENKDDVRNVDSPKYDCEKTATNEKCNDEAKVSNSLPNKRILRENKDRLMRKMKLRRTRVSKRLMGIDKKSNVNKGRPSTSQRLRKSNSKDAKSQKPFSKSTTLKKSKKIAKKRRGELANLVIDANIGPIVRGPRNRRLRCRTHIFAKMRHGSKDIVPSCCAEKVTDVTRSRKKQIARVELSTRKSKVLSVKSQIPKSRFKDNGARLLKNKVNNQIENKVKDSESKVNAFRKNLLQDQSTKGEKRKLSRTRSHSREEVRDEPRKILCNDSRDKNVNIRRVRMIDAATQYSTSQRDATTSIDREIIKASESNHPLNAIKIEWIDVEDVKSEIDENDESQRSIHDRSEELQSFYEDGQVSTIRRDSEKRPRVDKPPTIIPSSLSAFVPVKTSDGDFRIARLRSIGFKPIQPADIIVDDEGSSNDFYEDSTSNDSKKLSENTAVTSRDVDELFNKYTSEETTAVGYMDQELRYQDIEDEEITYKRKNLNVYGSAKRDRRVMRNEKNGRTETTDNRGVSLNEEDSEVPWHGWKKFIKNKQPQWVGW